MTLEMWIGLFNGTSEGACESVALVVKTGEGTSTKWIQEDLEKP
jgi:hypothetical protein